jgi:hypothetical protein
MNEARHFKIQRIVKIAKPGTEGGYLTPNFKRAAR